MRIELPGKVNGTARYAIDVKVPNMLYGTVLRAPVEGSVPDKIDDSKAKVIPGVVRIVRLPYGVGVLAEAPWAAFEARQALTNSVSWSRTGTAWGFDSDKGIERFAADAKNPMRGATEWSKSLSRKFLNPGICCDSVSGSRINKRGLPCGPRKRASSMRRVKNAIRAM